jgi:ABC-type Zn uptake system ZnuABC Zn-binding protein ZnuA
MSSRRLLVALAACAPFALAACGSDDEGQRASTTPEPEGPKVVATTTIAGDLVRNVAGDRAEVVTMLPVNADPHDYEPRPSDAKALTEAGLVVRSGGDLDEWLDDVVKSAGGDATEVTLIDAVETRKGGHSRGHEEEGQDDGHGHDEEQEPAEKVKSEKDEDHGEEGIDPHWWQNPANAVAAVEAIRAALVKADPEGAGAYDANAKAYTAELRALDTAIAACMRDVPESQRKLVTNHDAFGYVADRYDIEVVGTVIPSVSTQAQASAGAVTELVDTIEREKVKTIFAENTVNQRLERAIADRAGAQVGPPLWSDSLGDERSTGATYLDMLRFNAGALAEGFTGKAGACDLGAG